MLLVNLAKQFAKSRFTIGSLLGNSNSTSSSFHTSTPLQASSTKIGGAAAQFARRSLKDYQFPEIRSEDCEQTYISGWGPGGQNVNKLQNAAQLRHKPTNIVVKVHESRLLHDNIQIAFQRLKFAVDRQLNGENCYEAEFQRLQRKYEQKNKRAREKRRQLKVSSTENSS